MNQGHLITFRLNPVSRVCVLCVMNSEQTAVILKRFEALDDVCVLDKGAIRGSAFRRHESDLPY
jgi:hypothetical protein